MNDVDDSLGAQPTGAAIWVGRVISAIAAAVFLLSATMKFVGGPDAEEGLGHLGLTTSMVIPIAILEITCVVIYCIPASALVGAILLTGYMGGAILAHWRVGDLVVVQVVLPILVWLGLYLREPRLRMLIPIRRAL